MEITEVCTYLVRLQTDTWMWIAIKTSEGITGWGEVSPIVSPDIVAGTVEEISKHLIRTDPRQIITGTSGFFEWKFPSFESNLVVATAWSGIDQALWDIAAQSFNVPLYWMLGACGRDRIPLYANLNRALRKGDRSPEVFRNQAEQAIRSGFTTVKCTPFDEVQPFSEREELKHGMNRVKAVADVVPLSHIAIDCHERLRRESLAVLLEHFEHNNEVPFWVEDPMPMRMVMEFREIRHKYPAIRWAGGESVCSFEDLWRLMDAREFDVLMPDVKYVGGISQLKMIIPMAEQRGMWISLHNPTGPIGTAVSAHLSTLSRYQMPMEFPFGVSAMRQASTTPEEPVENGFYHLSDRPGIGLRPRAEFLQSYAQVWRDGHWKNTETEKVSEKSTPVTI